MIIFEVESLNNNILRCVKILYLAWQNARSNYLRHPVFLNVKYHYFNHYYNQIILFLGSLLLHVKYNYLWYHLMWINNYIRCSETWYAKKHYLWCITRQNWLFLLFRRPYGRLSNWYWMMDALVRIKGCVSVGGLRITS